MSRKARLLAFFRQFACIPSASFVSLQHKPNHRHMKVRTVKELKALLDRLPDNLYLGVAFADADNEGVFYQAGIAGATVYGDELNLWINLHDDRKGLHRCMEQNHLAFL